MGAILIILVIFMLISGKRRAMINDMYSLGRTAGLSTFEIACANAHGFVDLVSSEKEKES